MVVYIFTLHGGWMLANDGDGEGNPPPVSPQSQHQSQLVTGCRSHYCCESRSTVDRQWRTRPSVSSSRFADATAHDLDWTGLELELTTFPPLRKLTNTD